MNDELRTDTSADRTPPARGSAVPILAVVLLVALGGLGAALLLPRDRVEARPTGAYGGKAFFLAEVGLADGRAKLRAATDGSSASALADALRTAAGRNGALEFDAESLEVVLGADERIAGFTGYGDDVPLLRPVQFGDGWYAAFLTNDPGENSHSTTNLDERVLITGAGTAPDGSIEIVQAIVEPSELSSSATSCDDATAETAYDPVGGTATCGPGEAEILPDPTEAATCGPPADGSNCIEDSERPFQARDVVRFRQR